MSERGESADAAAHQMELALRSRLPTADELRDGYHRRSVEMGAGDVDRFACSCLACREWDEADEDRMALSTQG